MKKTHAADDNQIAQTSKVWEPRRGHSLTDDDARQISTNIAGFFSVLAEWAELETLVHANDTEKPITSDVEGARHVR